MKQYLTALFLCFVCLSATAQEQNPRTERPRMTPEEYQAKQKEFITRHAELTDEESTAFFPLYFEFQDKKKEINKEAWKIAKEGRKPETTESEYEEIIDKFFDNQEIITKLEKEYIKKYRKILSAKKIYMVYWAEIKFSRNMLKILQEMEDKEQK